MDHLTPLRIGTWRVEPASGQISRNGETTRLDVRAMRLLLCLAEKSGGVVSIDELIERGWDGVSVSSDSVYQAVTSLRRQLGDDSRNPTYIETVPRLGYRMIAAVCESPDDPTKTVSASAAPNEPSARKADKSTSRIRPMIWSIGTLTVAVVLAFLVYAKFAGGKHSTTSAATPPQRSIAVLPFLDLTEGMHSEEFADGMTEELIDKLSRVPGLQVPSATASFYYKGKQMRVGEIAHALNVAYILDGSVRKSSGRVRIAARLVRAENSYVLWTETYDRPFNDLIKVQDNIAGEVTKALTQSMPSGPQGGKS